MRLSDAEWIVMGALWDLAPATAREVHDATAGEADWAYTTVKTMLDRLAEKGAVKSRLAGNALRFTPLVSRRDARGTAVRSLLERAFDGTLGSLMHHMLSEERLSKRDREELRRLLDEHDAGRGKR